MNSISSEQNPAAFVEFIGNTNREENAPSRIDFAHSIIEKQFFPYLKALSERHETRKPLHRSLGN